MRKNDISHETHERRKKGTKGFNYKLAMGSGFCNYIFQDKQSYIENVIMTA